jgi:hypothetical protein
MGSSTQAGSRDVQFCRYVFTVKWRRASNNQTRDTSFWDAQKCAVRSSATGCAFREHCPSGTASRTVDCDSTNCARRRASFSMSLVPQLQLWHLQRLMSVLQVSPSLSHGSLLFSSEHRLDDAARIAAERCQLDCYKHRRLRACRSVRHVCHITIRRVCVTLPFDVCVSHYHSTCVCYITHSTCVCHITIRRVCVTLPLDVCVTLPLDVCVSHYPLDVCVLHYPFDVCVCYITHSTCVCVTLPIRRVCVTLPLDVCVSHYHSTCVCHITHSTCVCYITHSTCVLHYPFDVCVLHYPLDVCVLHYPLDVCVLHYHSTKTERCLHCLEDS